jgi:hypothetical protein
VRKARRKSARNWALGLATLHTALVPLSIYFRVSAWGTGWGLFWDSVSHYMDWPVSVFFQSHSNQERIMGPLAKWYASTIGGEGWLMLNPSLLAEATVFVGLGGIMYACFGYFLGSFLARRAE